MFKTPEEKRIKQRIADRKFRAANLERMRKKDRDRFHNNRESELARNKEYYPRYYAENKESIKKKRRNRRHNITQEWFDKRMEEQQNRCAICLSPFEKTPHIDHNHDCCEPLTSCDNCRRGLLCEDCNLGLGRFKDNPVALENAVLYLKKYERLNNDDGI